MKQKDWVLAVAEAVLWFYFTYYFLYSIKNDVDLFQSAFVLLIIAYAAILVCPWVRHTEAWKKMTGK